MIATLKIFSLLLSYPNTVLRQGMPELAYALRKEGLLGGACLDRVVSFTEKFAASDIYKLQEQYVHLFDRTRSLSLNMFEHVHGESRERGQAMVDLSALYEQSGYSVSTSELPDYVPVFLEFGSTQPLKQARLLLGEVVHITIALRRRLEARHSDYACIFAAMVELSDHPKSRMNGVAMTSDKDDLDDPDDLDALDRNWEEDPVVFGPEGAGSNRPPACAVAEASLSRMLEADAANVSRKTNWTNTTGKRR